MLGVVSKAIMALGIAGAALVAVDAKSFAGPETATSASIGSETSVPYGWVDFCQRYRGECQDDETEAQEVELTGAVYRKIARINAWVNKNIDPVSDSDHWGSVDQWDYPGDGKGDCEDFALLKRRMLIEEGFPRQALLLTVVKEKNGDGHSVLTVKTSRGEFVLDNLSDEMRPWTRVPYRFVKRQSQYNQNAWVAIAPPTSAPLYVSR
ncbi:MAG: transglutaminase [Alphaproteobacteria bacterium]|nr:transglutaminase [Alphaproteobacteria bacterium]MBM3624132.1 transglutaminase [Alphaproteobacteria bacterium]